MVIEIIHEDLIWALVITISIKIPMLACEKYLIASKR